MSTEIISKNIGNKVKDNIYLPSITLIRLLERQDNAAKTEELIDRVEKEIIDQYSSKAMPVIKKFRSALSKINYDSGKKSVVVHISPLYEKIIYLDMPLEERIMIDEPYEIRDLVNNLHAPDKYLVLVQSADNFKLYLGDISHLMKLKTSVPDNIAAYKNDIPEKIEYFSDSTDRKEIMLDKFIHIIDKELDDVLNNYKLPLFVIGPEKMNGHFKKLTHNGRAILKYIHGNYDEAKPHQLLHLIQPFLKEIKNADNQELQMKLEQAMNTRKLRFGIEEVWANAMHKKGSLLLVEKNYTYPHMEHDGNYLLTGDLSDVNPSFIKDAVDIIIEKVIEYGGEVRFVEPILLKDYQHIAMVLYYE